MQGKFKWSLEPVEIFTADARDRSEYVAFIIADGKDAIPYPCNKEDLIFDATESEVA